MKKTTGRHSWEAEIGEYLVFLLEKSFKINPVSKWLQISFLWLDWLINIVSALNLTIKQKAYTCALSIKHSFFTLGPLADRDAGDFKVSYNQISLSFDGKFEIYILCKP